MPLFLFLALSFSKKIQQNFMKGNVLTITPVPQKERDLDSTRQNFLPETLNLSYVKCIGRY